MLLFCACKDNANRTKNQINLDFSLLEVKGEGERDMFDKKRVNSLFYAHLFVSLQHDEDSC